MGFVEIKMARAKPARRFDHPHLRQLLLRGSNSCIHAVANIPPCRGKEFVLSKRSE